MSWFLRVPTPFLHPTPGAHHAPMEDRKALQFGNDKAQNGTGIRKTSQRQSKKIWKEKILPERKESNITAPKSRIAPKGVPESTGGIRLTSQGVRGKMVYLEEGEQWC